MVTDENKECFVIVSVSVAEVGLRSKLGRKRALKTKGKFKANPIASRCQRVTIDQNLLYDRLYPCLLKAVHVETIFFQEIWREVVERYRYK